MIIRKITPNDILAAEKIYEDAKSFMRSAGNLDQWSDGYPNRQTAIDDMNKGVGYVCEEDGEILAVFMYSEGDDPTYDEIYDGAWLNDKPYAVIHRIAVSADSHGKGVAAFCFNECFHRFPNLKMDTHRDNVPMQKALTRAGFEYCGVIHLEDGSPRLAYQKIK